MFPIVIVPDDAFERPESLGSKPKFWYEDATYGVCLFKEARTDTGEDWAEKIADFLCDRLDIPHARYELARWRGKRGTITQRVHANSERLFLGNELLARLFPDYGEATTPKGSNRLHTLDSVLACLEQYPPPDGFVHDTLNTAADVFVGYLMLDALINNTDRHHENWAGIASENGTGVRLAPTYDHASSLGRELADAEREKKLITRDRRADIEAYIQRGTSALYAGPDEARPLTLRDCFRLVAATRPVAAREWLTRLAILTEAEVDAGFRQVPDSRISEWGLKFGVELVLRNRNWLLDLGPMES
jgi:hypothetical protein